MVILQKTGIYIKKWSRFKLEELDKKEGYNYLFPIKIHKKTVCIT